VLKLTDSLPQVSWVIKLRPVEPALPRRVNCVGLSTSNARGNAAITCLPSKDELACGPRAAVESVKLIPNA
jgi:hypothetical protein